MLLDRHLAGVHWQAANGSVQPRLFRHVAEQIVDGVRADGRQHIAAVGVGQGEVTHIIIP